MTSMLRALRLVVAVLQLAACTRTAEEPAGSATAAIPAIPYGANAPAGGSFMHDDVSLYYETYGDDQPLLLVHGNGSSIGSMAAPIDFFKKPYKVIAMDSRDHRRSSDSEGSLTYERVADDLVALIDHLELDSVYVIGWSDSGIEAPLLGVRYPSKAKKIVSMAANLNPSTSTVHKEVAASMLASMPDSVRNTPAGRRAQKVPGMTLKEPNIDPTILERIPAPTLLLAGDHDIIRTEHTVEIFNHLWNAQLGIFPNSTHRVPFDDAELFNATIERFLSTRLRRRIA